MTLYDFICLSDYDILAIGEHQGCDSFILPWSKLKWWSVIIFTGTAFQVHALNITSVSSILCHLMQMKDPSSSLVSARQLYTVWLGFILLWFAKARIADFEAHQWSCSTNRSHGMNLAVSDLFFGIDFVGLQSAVMTLPTQQINVLRVSATAVRLHTEKDSRLIYQNIIKRGLRNWNAQREVKLLSILLGFSFLFNILTRESLLHSISFILLIWVA